MAMNFILLYSFMRLGSRLGSLSLAATVLRTLWRHIILCVPFILASFVVAFTASMTSFSNGLRNSASFSSKSTYSSASVKSKMALIDSVMCVAAVLNVRTDTVELFVKFLLSLGVALTVNVRSLMKGLLKMSITFVFPRPIFSLGIRTMLRKCCSFLLR